MGLATIGAFWAGERCYSTTCTNYDSLALGGSPDPQIKIVSSVSLIQRIYLLIGIIMMIWQMQTADPVVNVSIRAAGLQLVSQGQRNMEYCFSWTDKNQHEFRCKSGEEHLCGEQSKRPYGLEQDANRRLQLFNRVIAKRDLDCSSYFIWWELPRRIRVV